MAERRTHRYVLTMLLASVALGSCATTRHGYLLYTEWDQAGHYARYCPNASRAGCWSTAFAQILYFHGKTPAGAVSYETSNGYGIDENLDAYDIEFALFTNAVSNDTESESRDQVARYLYLTSVVLQKDFDTGLYRTVQNVFRNGTWTIDTADAIRNLEAHYAVQVTAFQYTADDFSAKRAEIRELIERELDSRRPLMLYTQANNNGHAAVIDGYEEKGGKFYVHINQGAGGYGNGWYDFFEPIEPRIDDLSYRVLFTVR